jgi:hypothetical protein
LRAEKKVLTMVAWMVAIMVTMRDTKRGERPVALTVVKKVV